ncbi:MAG: glycoside hydrolase 43 family protein [Muribaculaceae bacterium]|nr:glycoside hydrolase 43 family protein [Muribaculaceae bacterium]
MATLAAPAASWTADNGNGTFTNPILYDEFSDPDIIRVGDTFYVAGTTMHTVPGVVILESKDLVNWNFLSYCTERLDFGPGFDLAEGQNRYGGGIWAPCIRYHNGTFYVISNINGTGTQVYAAENPAGPWRHLPSDFTIHDSSVLFDDDGRVYAVYGYDCVRVVELKPDLSGIVEGSEQVIIPAGNTMGEGHHIYKIDGNYYIISANYSPVGRMTCARADNILGPYETVTISAHETMGEKGFTGLSGLGRDLPHKGDKFEVHPPDGNYEGAVPLHQGGLVQAPDGSWWGFSMTDFHSVGRTFSISPVTWSDGWPFFGLPGNPGRTPRTWTKPVQGHPATAPYERSDSFDGPALNPIWQWNHNPAPRRWSLRKGKLRIDASTASDLLRARNTLTQRVIGPQSTATVTLHTAGLRDGDEAGIAFLNIPYASLGVVRDGKNLIVRRYTMADDATTDLDTLPAGTRSIVLRAGGTFDRDSANFEYSTDGGATFKTTGTDFALPYQLKTFQGSRYALYAYNAKDGARPGYAEFDDFTVDEPMADRSANLPVGRTVTFTNKADGSLAWASPHGMLHTAGAGSPAASGDRVRFKVHDRGMGRVALEAESGGFLAVTGKGLSADVRVVPEEQGDASLFVWQDMLRGECMLLSEVTGRYLTIEPGTGAPYSALSPGCRPDRLDGSVLTFDVVE